jgi:tetratricopeptide (TPR) repeat protein
LSAALAWTLNRARRPNIDLSGLTENERRQLATRGSKNIQAYENYVNGRRLWHQRSAEGLYQSIVLLERAVKADPEFALARAALADAYAFDTEKRFSAAAEARETIRLDPTLGQSYAALGFVQMFWEWKLPDARESFAKAVELSPDYATAHQWYALNLIAGNNGGAALAEMKRAFELEPNSLAINADLCQIQYFLRKYDDAIAQCRRTLEMDAGFINAHFYLYEIYTAKEMHAEAVAEFFKIEELKSDFTLPFADLEKLRKAFERGGIRAFWLARIEILQSGPHFYGLARYHARLGEKEKALAFLFKASAAREFDFVFVVADPVFRDLISDRQLAELTQALELSKKSN